MLAKGFRVSVVNFSSSSFISSPSTCETTPPNNWRRASPSDAAMETGDVAGDLAAGDLDLDGDLPPAGRGSGDAMKSVFFSMFRFKSPLFA